MTDAAAMLSHQPLLTLQPDSNGSCSFLAAYTVSLCSATHITSTLATNSRACLNCFNGVMLHVACNAFMPLAMKASPLSINIMSHLGRQRMCNADPLPKKKCKANSYKTSPATKNKYRPGGLSPAVIKISPCLYGFKAKPMA